MADRLDVSPLSAFAMLARPRAPDAAGLVVSERLGLGLATVTLRRDARAAFAARLDAAFGIALVDGPRVSGAGDIAFVGTGPSSFLCVKPGGGWRFAGELAETLAGTASVCDQSSGYAVLRLSGPRLRDVLAKGVPIDLDASAFATGDAAVTLASHVGIVLWQVDAEPSVDVAVPRSLAQSFWHWLEASAAEFGMGVTVP